MVLKEGRFNPPELPDPIVLGATNFNAGVFGGIHHDELDHDHEPTLNSAENLVQRALTAYLQRHDRVVFLDLGAMCGLSATIVAEKFSKEISHGNLMMIATELEQEYSIDNMLSEAKKRLTLQPLHQQLTEINRSTLIGNDIHELDKALEKTKLFLNAGELKFMESNHRLIHFITDVDTQHLPEVLNEKLGISKTHVLHEFSAGLTFAENKREAAIAVADIMAPDGMMFTIAGWHHYNDNTAFLQWESRGVSAKDLTLPGLPSKPSYALFTFPDAPRVI